MKVRSDSADGHFVPPPMVRSDRFGYGTKCPEGTKCPGYKMQRYEVSDILNTVRGSSTKHSSEH